MNIPARIVAVGLALLLLALMASACNSTKQDDETDDTVTIAIKVVRDQIYDLETDRIIGEAKFNKEEGQIGVRVRGLVYVDTLSRFEDQQISARLELLNQDAAREPYDAVEWVQQTNTEEIDFVIPVVETIPSQLNFRILLYDYRYQNEKNAAADDDTADDDSADDDTADDDNDTSDDDTGDDDTGDDDTGDDDTGDDDTPEPDLTFEAEGIFSFLVDRGQPGTGD